MPRHLGIILDGNRRWAKLRGLSELEGHSHGYENFKEIVAAAFEVGVEYISAYVFSTENWNRTEKEVKFLLSLAHRVATKDLDELIDKNIKIVVLGVEDNVPQKIMKAWRRAEEASAGNTGGTLALCFNYGGLREISDATRRMIADGIDADDIDERSILEYVYHPEIPPLDLVIRTSGEQRISNFMLPRIAYAELYFSEKLWPDFTKTDLSEALDWYAGRDRRRGT